MPSELERRILVLAPTRKDSELANSVLTDNEIPCTVCTGLEELVDELKYGASALLVAEEIIVQGPIRALQLAIDQQPPWSDLPVILLTQRGADSPAVAEAIATLGNVTLLERPTRITAFASAARSALRARVRQYEARDLLAEREQTAESLKRADRHKDEFLATLAHELRNPLAPIRNALHILQMTACNEPAVDRVCQLMERQINQLVRLVDDLMEVSRITRGKIELRREPAELAGIIRSAVEASRPIIDAAGHQLAISLPDEPIIVNGDAVRLAQVFDNLLNNAAKYTDEGGQIWMSVKRVGDEAVVSVRDNGIGIPAEFLPQVFDMFTQADRSTNRAQGGLGIGLTLVKSLVESHGGSISVHSEGPGQGSEFIVRLPVLSLPSSTALKAGRHKSSKVLPARRILVVDDNVDSATSLGTILKFLGADVQVVHDGPAALAAIEAYRPEVVLLDIGMPGMDGFQVAERVRQRPEFHHIMLIALTGWGQEEDRRRTRAAGFDHHLVKPADISALQSLLMPSGCD